MISCLKFLSLFFLFTIYSSPLGIVGFSSKFFFVFVGVLYSSGKILSFCCCISFSNSSPTRILSFPLIISSSSSFFCLFISALSLSTPIVFSSTSSLLSFVEEICPGSKIRSGVKRTLFCPVAQPPHTLILAVGSFTFKMTTPSLSSKRADKRIFKSHPIVPPSINSAGPSTSITKYKSSGNSCIEYGLTNLILIPDDDDDDGS
mmetsp:Transcript_7633/g.8746  ORF Transcript_7633/g.8746 Transcript_7633/m.8746 type:complete len:204 (-) Transcript_7633:87-698(-)